MAVAECGILDNDKDNNNISNSDVNNDEDYQRNSKDGSNTTFLDLPSEKGNDAVVTAQNAIRAAPQKSTMTLQKTRKTTTIHTMVT